MTEKPAAPQGPRNKPALHDWVLLAVVVLAALAMIAFVVESVVLIRHSALWGAGHV